MISQSMLNSFIGTIDRYGLRTLSVETKSSASRVSEDRNRFWAVLDSSILPTVSQAMACGQRKAALEIVLKSAKDAGSV